MSKYDAEQTEITGHWWYRHQTELFYKVHDCIAIIKSRTRLGAVLSMVVRKKIHSLKENK